MTRPLYPWVINLLVENTHVGPVWKSVAVMGGCLSKLLLHAGDLLVGQADGVDHVGE